MSYLAEKKIMHGDLAARNILMSEDPLKRKCPLAKVADFGLAKKFYSNEKYRKASRMCVPWKWMAIEYLKDDYFTLKSDVWSFAVLIWEILSFGREPYGHQDYDQILTNLEQGYRLPFPESSKNCLSFDHKNMYKALSDVCFKENLDNRANFPDVVNIIENYLTSEDKIRYSEMKEIYQQTRTDKYLKMGQEKLCNDIPKHDSLLTSP